MFTNRIWGGFWGGCVFFWLLSEGHPGWGLVAGFVVAIKYVAVKDARLEARQLRAREARIRAEEMLRLEVRRELEVQASQTVELLRNPSRN